MNCLEVRRMLVAERRGELTKALATPGAKGPDDASAFAAVQAGTEARAWVDMRMDLGSFGYRIRGFRSGGRNTRRSTLYSRAGSGGRRRKRWPTSESMN
jgi:hypothetical protein